MRLFVHNLEKPKIQRVSKKKWNWLWCEKSTHSSSKPSSRACTVINFTLSIQVSHCYPLSFAKENDLCESCSKSPSLIWTYTMLWLEMKQRLELVNWVWTTGKHSVLYVTPQKIIRWCKIRALWKPQGMCNNAVSKKLDCRCRSMCRHSVLLK